MLEEEHKKGKHAHKKVKVASASKKSTSKTPTKSKEEESKKDDKKGKGEDTRVYVMDTGASKGDLLVGCSAANKGLVIKLICCDCVYLKLLRNKKIFSCK